MSLTLVLNGQQRTFESLMPLSTLDELIAELGLRNDRVAIEHNGKIANREAWPTTVLNLGDKLEVVHFVGGGSL